MKWLLLIVLYLACLNSFGQIKHGTTIDSSWIPKGITGNGSVKSFLKICDSNKTGWENEEIYSSCKYYLMYENKSKIDTLVIEEDMHKRDSCTIKEIQLDGKGQKEIVLSWNIYTSTNYGEHGGIVIKYHLNEIWNLDSTKQIFAVIDNYHSESDYTQYYNDADSSTNEKWSCDYSCELTLEESIIRIANIQGDQCKDDWNWFDDLCFLFKEGEYGLIEGAYRKLLD